MSGIIHSSDADAQRYYKDAVRKHQDDYDEEIQEIKDSNDKEIARLQKRQDQEIKKINKNADETVENNKENAQKAIEDARKVALTEIQNLKSKLYNREGKVASESSDIRDQLKYAQEEYQKQHDQLALREAENSKNYDDKVNQLSNQYEEGLQNFQTDYATRMDENHDQAQQKYKNQLQSQKKDHEDFQNELLKEYQAHSRDQKNKYLESHRVTNLENEKNLNGIEKHAESLQEKRAYAHQRELSEGIQKFRDSRNSETESLRASVKDFIDSSKEYQRGQAEGRSDAIKEYEGPWMDKLEQVSKSNEEQIASLKNHAKYADEERSRSTAEKLTTLNMKNAYQTRDLLSQEETKRTDLISSYDKAIHEKDIHFEKEKVSQNLRFQNSIDSLQKSNELTLEKQAEANRNTLSNQTKSFSQRENALQDELNLRKTTDDASLVSPLAAEKIRRNLLDEYEKVSKEKTKANNLNLDQTRELYAERNRQNFTEFSDRENKLIRQTNLETQKSKSEFINHIQNLSDMSQTQKREIESFHERTLNKQNQTFAQTLEDQKRHFNQVIDTMRINNESEKSKIIETANFDRQLDLRKTNQRIQDLSRQYENTLSTQKNHYEIQIGELKSEKEFELQKLRAENRVMMESQERQADQKLQAMKQSQEEREKNIHAKYEKELNNMRNAHERLIRQKG